MRTFCSDYYFFVSKVDELVSGDFDNKFTKRGGCKTSVYGFAQSYGSWVVL